MLTCQHSQQYYVPSFGFPEFALTGIHSVLFISIQEQLLMYITSDYPYLRQQSGSSGRTTSLNLFSKHHVVITFTFCTDCHLVIQVVLAELNATDFSSLLLPRCDSLESGDVFSGSDPAVAGQPMFPQSVQVWNDSNANISVRCFAAPLLTPVPFECYNSWHADPTNNTYCGTELS